MRKAVAWVVLLLVGSGAWAGVLSAVTGPADLDLSGTVYYAVSQGSTIDNLVAGTWLEGDNDGDPAPVGYTVSTSVTADVWDPANIDPGLYPGLYGAYKSIRYDSSDPRELSLTFAHLPPGEQLKVQLLLSEGAHTEADSSQRPLDITIEGNLEFDDLNPITEWGYRNAGLATALATVSSDGILNVDVTAPTGPDRSPILNAIIVSAPGITAVTSPSDLDLTRVRYAVNVGGDDDRVVAGVPFEADDDGDVHPVGYSVNSTTIGRNWGSPAIADPALREVYDDIRYRGGTGATSGVIQSFANLAPDRPVKVQVLLSEGHHPQPSDPTARRPLDIIIEGQKMWDDLDPVELWGKNNPGVATTWAHVGADGVLNVQTVGNAGYDTNAIVNGIIVSTAPGQKITPASVVASSTYDARFPASAVLDGSWAEHHPAHPDYPGVADYWLMKSGVTGHLEFDLGDKWNLQFVEIHNTDNYTYTDRGTIAYHIDISPDPTFAAAETIAAGTLITYDQGWYMRPLATDEFWRYARFYVDDFGGSDRQNGGGLAEIAFYGVVPEPSSLSLLALGGIGLLIRRRRRKSS